MSYTERRFQAEILTPYLKKNANKSMLIEAKVVKGKTFNFNNFRPGQLPALYKAKHHTFVYKIPDTFIGYKGADVVILHKVDSYLAILFQKDKTPRKYFYLIDVDIIIDLIKEGKKSLNIDDAEAFGIKISISLS